MKTGQKLVCHVIGTHTGALTGVLMEPDEHGPEARALAGDQLASALHVLNGMCTRRVCVRENGLWMKHGLHTNYMCLCVRSVLLFYINISG